MVDFYSGVISNDLLQLSFLLPVGRLLLLLTQTELVYILLRSSIQPKPSISNQSLNFFNKKKFECSNLLDTYFHWLYLLLIQ